MRLALALVIAASALAARPALAQRDPCRDIGCSAHGACFEERGRAHCFCDRGYAVIGHACVEVEEPDVLRMRRDPTAGQRAADLAMTQLERGRGAVGRGVDDLPVEPLAAYLEVDEWWCSDFVAWVYAAVGAPFSGGAAGGWLVTNNRAMRAWFQQRGLWVPRDELVGYEPRPGDYLRIETDRGGHAAVVHHVEGTTLYAVEGNVSGTVELSRYWHYPDNPLIDGVGQLSLPNEAPTVDAGEAITVVLPDPVSLEGEVTDDGPDNRLRVGWSVERGPGGATLVDPTSPVSELHLRAPGVYQLALFASDGEHEVTDPVEVRAIANEPPLVAARAFDVSAFHGTAQLDADVEDDGVIRPLELVWSQSEGPGPASFDQPFEAATAVTFPLPGRYLLRLVADDGASEGQDAVEVVVPEWPGSCAAAGRPGRSGGALPAWLLLAWLGRARRWRSRRSASS